MMTVPGAVRGLFIAGYSSHQSVTNQVDLRAVILLVVGFTCLAAPLEIRQVAFVIVGAVIYASLQAANAPGHSAAQTAAFTAAPSVGYKERSELLAAESLDPSVWQEDESRFATGSSSSAAPATQWEKEVAAILGQLVPTPEAEAAVQNLARGVKHALRRLVPEAEVTAVATGDLGRCGVGAAMAAPEVDVVVSAAPEVLLARLQGRIPGRAGSAAAAAAVAQQVAHQDELKLQKSAIRACVDRLVSSGGFKFRRSAFRGQEPKVTLLAPASLGFYCDAIPLDFSVNASTPLYNAALLSECGRMDPRAKDLILLVKRWAKDRGVCHTAKGHLSPYAWSLLTIYFLQVSTSDEGPLLPPFAGLQLGSGLTVPRRGEMPPEAQAASVVTAARAVAQTQATTGAVRGFLTQGAAASVAQLFKDFVRFYDQEFEWQKEAVSVRSGQRAPPEDSLPIFMIPAEENGGIPSEAGPSIEDPFNPRRNLGDCMTMLSFRRLKEELKRAEECSAHDAPLADLLEPWAPPEREVPPVERNGCEDQSSPSGNNAKSAEIAAAIAQLPRGPIRQATEDQSSSSGNNAKSAEIAAAIAQLPRGPTRQATEVDFAELARSIGPPPGLDLPPVPVAPLSTRR